MDNNNKEVTPREFKAGDVVWDCTKFGKGVIEDVDNTTWPIIVRFDNGEVESYLKDGRLHIESSIPSLYHQPYKIELLDIPEELPEVGTPVYVWDDDSLSCRIGFFAKKSEHGYTVSLCFPEPGDLYTWKYLSLNLPDKFK